MCVPPKLHKCQIFTNICHYTAGIKSSDYPQFKLRPGNLKATSVISYYLEGYEWR